MSKAGTKRSSSVGGLDTTKFPVNYAIQRYERANLKLAVELNLQDQIVNTESIVRHQYNTSLPVSQKNPNSISLTSDRDFVTVYEYKVGNNYIIWDYSIGWVYITSIWKSAGHYKADVLKLVSTSPEIQNQVYKTKGGCLKVQGTWIQYDVAKKLASRFCYPIRFSLVPVFGNDFVELCLKTGEPGYGLFQLVISGRDLNKKKRKRRSPHFGSSKQQRTGQCLSQAGQTAGSVNGVVMRETNGYGIGGNGTVTHCQQAGGKGALYGFMNEGKYGDYYNRTYTVSNTHHPVKGLQNGKSTVSAPSGSFDSSVSRGPLVPVMPLVPKPVHSAADLPTTLLPRLQPYNYSYGMHQRHVSKSALSPLRIPRTPLESLLCVVRRELQTWNDPTDPSASYPPALTSLHNSISPSSLSTFGKGGLGS